MDAINKDMETKNLEVLVVTEYGLGKKTGLSDYKVQKRAGSGVKTVKITTKTGKIMAMMILDGSEEKDLVIISKHGQTIRTPLKSIATLSRATQGVRVMRMAEGDTVASVALV